MDYLGNGHLQTRHLADSGPFHKRNDLARPINKNVDLRMQLVLQHQHPGQHIRRVSHPVNIAITLELGFGG